VEPFTHWTIGTHKAEGHFQRRFDLYEPMVNAVCFPDDYPAFEMGKVVTKAEEITDPGSPGRRRRPPLAKGLYTPDAAGPARLQEVHMGLLDDLLGGMAGQGMGGRAQPQPTRAGGGGAGMSQVLIALMPVVLGMLANRGSGGGSPTQRNFAPGAGGGIGDVLGQVLGGGAGGGGAMGGGLGGLLEQLQQAGFGEQANSWVGRGSNKPISPDAMTQIFGRDGLEQISRQAGISEDEASQGLSQLLPEVVDRMTPEGEVPEADALANSVDDFAKRLGLS
jgi:uncharacterized protein YidB (DUF937 family)